MNPPVWRKSSRSTEGTSPECIEVARLDGVVGVRDSKDPDGSFLQLEPEAFGTFVAAVKRRR
ncbi:DUF397 domain-containing protein [Spirillospora sp. NPDC047279]|uniref:DUF397 domain-containing protein n=1 Tax=Spirillospora sp. NPDC047279 TaxID=3155478 RepID=UPI0033E0D650